MTKQREGYIKAKAEYELVYKGKESKSKILTNTLVAPLQEIRVFNDDNPWEDGWRNMLIFGDNLMALKTLYDDLKEGGLNKYGLRNKIKLIYIDPPFATKKDFMKDKEKAYRDKVIGAQFIEFLRKRLIFLREILADDGSIYVHLDQKKGHYIKSVLDEVFGESNFRNEIIWQKVRVSKAQSLSWGVVHDSVFFYSKTENFIFNTQYAGLSQSYIKSHYTNRDEGTGRIYQLCDLTQAGQGPSRIFGDKGEIAPPEGKHWIYRQTTITKLLDDERIVFTSGKMPRLKRYLDESKGTPITDIWEDIYPINSQALEKLDYPTQKPEDLLERIISASSNEGDVIVDCFAGSGTSLAVAEKLSRKWIGMDVGKLSVYTIQNRLINLTNQIGADVKDKRSQTQRIENLSEIEKTRGYFFISEKARNGELDITDDFFYSLHEFLKVLPRVDSFSLVCPEKKFHLTNIEEDDDGIKTIQRDHIAYKFSFIEEKEKSKNGEALKAKTFVVNNVGIYDKNKILKYNWNEYKDFVMKLFEVRSHPHSINGFHVDGYIGVNSAVIWNYPEKMNTAIDYEYVNQLHAYLGGKGGDRFFVILPKDSINFMEDDVQVGNTVYTFLKVPASVLIRLIEANRQGKTDALASFKQPKSENDVNEVIDAFGFDFISQPVVQYELLTGNEINGLFTDERLVIRLNEFYSDGLLYSPEDFKNFETLSLVMVDFNYKPESPFTLDQHFWGNDLVKGDAKTIEITLDPEKWVKDKLAVILIDIYGNEKSLVFKKEDFKHGNKSKKQRTTAKTE